MRYIWIMWWQVSRTFLSLNPGRCLWSFAIFNIASLCDNLSTMVRRLYIWGISWYALTACGYNFWNSDERSSYVLVLYSSSGYSLWSPLLLPYSYVLADISQCCSQARLYQIWLWHEYIRPFLNCALLDTKSPRSRQSSEDFSLVTWIFSKE